MSEPPVISKLPFNRKKKVRKLENLACWDWNGKPLNQFIEETCKMNGSSADDIKILDVDVEWNGDLVGFYAHNKDLIFTIRSQDPGSVFREDNYGMKMVVLYTPAKYRKMMK